MTQRGNPNWTKGVSGNPGGRPKEVRAVIEAARQEGVASILALVRIRDESADPRAVVAAANAILDRGFGKPAQTVDMNVTRHAARPREMSLDEIRERKAELLAELAAEGSGDAGEGAH